MGFVSDFSPLRPQPTQVPVQQQATPTVKKERGFFADFGPAPTEAPQDVYRDAPPELEVQPESSRRPLPAARSRSSPASTQPEEPRGYTYNAGPLLMGGAPETSASTVSQRDIDSVGSEIRRLSERLGNLKGPSSGGKISELESELSSAKSSLSGAKESVSEKRERLSRLEHYLDRTKRIVSRMEMRQSGFDSGWTRGYGGGGHWRNNDEFLYSRDELRGPEHAEERKAQMALVLDSKRDKVWELQDQVSSARSGLSSAESRVKELEQKIERKTDELYRARLAKQNASEAKSGLESKISELKERYQKMTGKSYSGGLFF